MGVFFDSWLYGVFGSWKLCEIDPKNHVNNCEVNIHYVKYNWLVWSRTLNERDKRRRITFLLPNYNSSILFSSHHFQ